MCHKIIVTHLRLGPLVAGWFGQNGYSLHIIFFITSALWLVGAFTIYFTYVDVFNVTKHEFEPIPLEDLADTHSGIDGNVKRPDGLEDRDDDVHVELTTINDSRDEVKI